MMAGAAAVGIGSAQFINPNAAVEILEGMEGYCQSRGIESFSDLVGFAHRV